MELIRLTPENLEREHICCDMGGGACKKAWLRGRLPEGLVFLKGDVRGKCFIEYLPAEAAWAPVDAPGYLYIDCFWVSGKFKGQGNGAALLEACVADARAQGKAGVMALSSEKKRPYLSDGAYLKAKGFRLADTAAPYFSLLYLPLRAGADAPRFRAQARAGRAAGEGFTLYHTHQCPFTAKYAPLAEEAAKARGLPLRRVLIDSRAAAQAAPTPFPTYSLFYNGAFVTHEILSVPKFEALADSLRATGAP